MEKPLTKNISSNGGEPPDRKAYETSGGYAGLRKAMRMTAIIPTCTATFRPVPG